jgi:hypothetical protein
MSDFYFEVKGKKWFVEALAAGDLKKFATWAQYKPYNDFRAQKDNCDPEDYREISREILRDCSTNTYKVGSTETADAMRTPEGAAFLVYLSLVKTYPTTTPAEVEDLLDTTVLEEAIQQVMLASGWMNDDEDEDLKKKMREKSGILTDSTPN